MKKTIAVLLCMLFVVSCLAGCGAKSSYSASVSAPSYAPSYVTEAVEEEASMQWANDEKAENSISTVTSAAAGAPVDKAKADAGQNISEKIIYSAYISLETTEFDSAIASLEAMVNSFGGYIESSNVSGYTRYNSDGSTTVVDRYANYTVAIPSGNFEAALNQAGSLGNITNKNRSAENITSRYTDVSARIDSLQVQEERLLAMMKETTEIESLIALEERLSEVTYEKESYQRTLNNYDRQVAYSTITFYVNEVEIYTPTVTVTRTFGEKLSDAFRDGWKSFARGWQNFVLWLAEALPTLLLFAVIVVVTILAIKKGSKRRAAKKAAKMAAQAAAAAQQNQPRI